MTPHSRLLWLLAALAVAGMLALGLWGREDARAQEPLYDGGATWSQVSVVSTGTEEPRTGRAARAGTTRGMSLLYPSPCVTEPAALTASTGRTTTPATDLLPRELHRLRIAKCRYLVERLYPRSGFAPYIEFFISEHERLGMAEAWWDSLTYGAANFSLRVGARAPGNCCGPLDVKGLPLALDPQENIRRHCREMASFYRRGVRGRRLCECVFYPRRPHDWGGGRFRRTDRRHRECIERAYREGELP